MNNSVKNKELAIFSGVHFAVDLACIFLMTAFVVPFLVRGTDWIWCAVIYNLFAFAFQLPIGAIGDAYGHPRRLSAIGCFLVSFAYLIIGVKLLATNGLIISSVGLNPYSILASVIAGIGNSCFHVGGGISTIRDSHGKATRAGIFVSTGAMGVFLAPKLAAKGFGVYVGLLGGFLLMIVAGSLLWFVSSKSQSEIVLGAGSKNTSLTTGNVGFRIDAMGCLAILLLLLTVCIRSYTGVLFSYQWKSEYIMGLLFTVGIILGKMFGGIVGDRIGWIRSSVGSLTLSLILFQFANNSPLCGIIGVLLFNMTMPITLMAIANMLGKEFSGTAFGMTTLALFIGTVPSSLEGFLGIDLTPMWMIAPTIGISIFAIMFGIRLAQRVDRNPSESINSDKGILKDGILLQETAEEVLS